MKGGGYCGAMSGAISNRKQVDVMPMQMAEEGNVFRTQ
jgi:hypothetical protein